jgi:hypothetical protein
MCKADIKDGGDLLKRLLTHDGLHNHARLVHHRNTVDVTWLRLLLT